MRWYAINYTSPTGTRFVSWDARAREETYYTVDAEGNHEVAVAGIVDPEGHEKVTGKLVDKGSYIELTIAPDLSAWENS